MVNESIYFTQDSFNLTQLRLQNTNSSLNEITPEPIVNSIINSSPPTEPSVILPAPSEPSEQSLHLLKHYYGHDEFRPCQWEIISNALNKIDQVVIMSTGSFFNLILIKIFRLWQKFMFSNASIARKLCCFGNFAINFTHGRSS